MRPLILIAVLLLAGCATAPKPGTTPPPPPKIAAPSPSSLAACEPPVKLRAGAMTQQQVETAWAVDVDHLIECGSRHRILVNYVRKRDAGLSGVPR